MYCLIGNAYAIVPGWLLAENADHPCPLWHDHFVYILSGGN